MVEHSTFNRPVPGSNPGEPTRRWLSISVAAGICLGAVALLLLFALLIVSGYTSINAVVKAELFPAEVRALEGELKTASPEARAAMTGKMKAAAAALAATKHEAEQAKAAAQPKDIADIVVTEPVTIRVLPGEKK